MGNPIQYCYYNDKMESTISGEASMTSREKLVNGTFFKENDKVQHIITLGVQTIPGVKFYVNHSIYPIIVDQSGLFYLNFEDKTYIYDLKFDNESINLINNNDNAYLIIDLVMEEEDFIIDEDAEDTSDKKHCSIIATMEEAEDYFGSVNMM